MTDRVYKGEVLNFYSLLEKHDVEIPIIQRDYAQGRKDQKEIRLNFLMAIKDSLNNLKPIKLDFIYGSTISGKFQPLDGQQRLTTLFLLYWYASLTCHESSSDIRQKLSKFSYETRISSREFCNSLINNAITIDNKNTSIKSQIIDKSWFFLIWKKDPTIDSMLRTIDDIHSTFIGMKNLWKLLTDEDCLISFYYVELENIGLTDDLYIKMNARGKLLTQFENFKASLQKRISDKNWEGDQKHNDQFLFKIDTCWTDYYWTNFKRNNSVDDGFMRFISVIAMIRSSLEKSTMKSEDRIHFMQNIHEDPNTIKASFFSEASYLYLYKCLDLYYQYSTNKIDLKLSFLLWRHQPKKSILSEIVYEEGAYSTSDASRVSYSLKVLLYAQTEYLLRSDKFDKNFFSDWMRVIRNIVSRGDIDNEGKRPDVIRSPQTFDGAINLVNELAKGCGDIYKYLSSDIELGSTFSKGQIDEERKKARIIIQKPKLKQLIFDTEDNELLRGKIEFVFYCIDYDNNVENINSELLEKVMTVFKNNFNCNTLVTNVLRRAMLTIDVNGIYEFYNYWWSRWYFIDAIKRKLFDNNREIEFFIYSDQKEYFKRLVLKLINQDFQSIIDDFDPPATMPNWKKRLIKEPSLLDQKGKSYFIAIPDDEDCCYLLKSKRPRDMEGCFKVE